jgi:hypothetical protein
MVCNALRLGGFLMLFCQAGLSQVPADIQRYRDEPRGSWEFQLKGKLEGNNVSCRFFNTGEVEHWPDDPRMEWPKGSRHTYLDGLTIVVGARVDLPGGGFITPIEAHYREEFDFDPALGSQYPWDLEPIPGYAAPGSTSLAISSQPNTWPAPWPAALNLPPEYNGQWYGHAGKGVQKGLTEAFFVVDDSKDAEFKASPYNYFPLSSDTARGGLGLRVEVRGLQWDHPLLRDIIFWQYRLTNISDHDYDSTAFGYFYDPGVGSYHNSSPPNSTFADTALDMCYSWTEGGVGYPDNYRTGYIGIGFLTSPGNSGMTSALSWILGDKGPTGMWPKNDNVIWKAMTGGIIEETNALNSNIGSLMATGSFAFPRWATDTVTSAILFANDVQGLREKKFIAQIIANNNFRLPESLTHFGDFTVHVDAPAKGSVLSGTTDVAWTTTGNSGKTVAYLCYSRQDTDWVSIGIDSTNSGHFIWDTRNSRDGIFYTLRIISVAENGIGFAETDSTFTINNTGNVPPDVIFTAPATGDTLSAMVPIRWMAGDADGDTTHVSLSYRVPALFGDWIPIADNLPADSRLFLWDTRQAANGTAALRVVATSGWDSASVALSPVSIFNERITIPGQQVITERKTNGTGFFEVHVLDSAAVTGDEYIVQFSSLPGTGALGYNVYNLRTGQQVLENAGVGDTRTEGPYFDGVRLVITSDSIAAIDQLTGWQSGLSNLRLLVFRDRLNPSRDLASPSDYTIVWFSTAVDTTVFNAGPRFPKIPITFVVTNLTEDSHVGVIVDDYDRSGDLTLGDTIRFIEPYVSPTIYNLSWQVTYGAPLSGTPVHPVSGDVFAIHTTKPYLPGDTIIFASAPLVDVRKQLGQLSGRPFLWQNYPNPFNPRTEIRFQLPGTRWVTITIFDLLGREVATLLNESRAAGVHTVQFEGSGLASGVYLCRLRAGDYVQTRKLLLVR